MRLKLIEGPLSYNGIIRATANKPIVEVEDEAVAALAMASGYFINLDAKPDAVEDMETADADPADETGNMQYGGKLLTEMNKSELETFATYKDVDIKGCKTKNQIISALKETLPEEDLEGLIYYGSPTMVDLQR